MRFSRKNQLIKKRNDDFNRKNNIRVGDHDSVAWDYLLREMVL